MNRSGVEALPNLDQSIPKDRGCLTRIWREKPRLTEAGIFVPDEAPVAQKLFDK
jgi:hypothetical protein